MRVGLKEVETGDFVNGLIERSSRRPLPSLHDEEWKFDFARLSRQLRNASTYVLVAEDTPQTIEGCLIFQLIDGVMPYGAYLEVALHNRGDEKKYDYVAGCLIAYAYQLSLDKGVGAYNGQLYFIVSEASKEDEDYLKNHYINHYGAEELEDGSLRIDDESGPALIEKYLNEEQDTTDV